MGKNKHKEKTIQTLAQKAAKTKIVEPTTAEEPKTTETTETKVEVATEAPVDAVTAVETVAKETKEEKKARQKAEYEEKKAAKKAAKEAAKEAKKAAEKKEEKPIEKAEQPKEEPKAEKPKVEEPKVEEIKAEEIVEETSKKVVVKQSVSKNVTSAIRELAKGDRISADHQIQFLGLIKSEYLDKGKDIPAEHRAAYQKIFNEGMAMNCLFLHEQLMREGQEMLGIKLDDKVGPVLTTLLEDCWGITCRALPSTGDGQLRLEFDVPNDVKESVKEDITTVEEVAKEVTENDEKTFPDPDPALPMAERVKILRAILSQPGTQKSRKDGKDQMTVNIYNGIEWAKKAFGMEKDSPSQVLAVMFEKLYKHGTTRPTALAGASARVWGITTRYNNLLTAHAILGGYYNFTGYSDEDISNIFKVLYAHHLRYIAERNIGAGKPKTTTFTEEEIDKYQTEQGYEQLAAVPDVVINAICNGEKLERKLKYLTDASIDGEQCLTAIKNQCSNSESIAKSIVKKLAPFYTSQIERIAKYADLSSYKN